ncbi:hypothetical protein SAY86_026311 [Trapa natans]|uniref:Uncharacterized protein n=1 Tax=Trapa natans TaxID=22666 RepID=A0AAN7KE33_TRANT|nr:hypothetical protein SAY86_026311 [Trapa natans]
MTPNQFEGSHFCNEILNILVFPYRSILSQANLLVVSDNLPFRLGPRCLWANPNAYQSNLVDNNRLAFSSQVEAAEKEKENQTQTKKQKRKRKTGNQSIRLDWRIPESPREPSPQITWGRDDQVCDLGTLEIGAAARRRHSRAAQDSVFSC